MDTELKHARVKTITPQADGSTVIETKSYFEKLNSVKEEVQLNILTTKTSLLSDFIRCLDVINNDTTKELTVQIKIDHDKLLIIKTWTRHKQSHLDRN